MLVLGRKENQSFMVGNRVRVTILEARTGGYVRIGIEAPSGVKVLRTELAEVCQVCFEIPCICPEA